MKRMVDPQQLQGGTDIVKIPVDFRFDEEEPGNIVFYILEERGAEVLQNVDVLSEVCLYYSYYEDGDRDYRTDVRINIDLGSPGHYTYIMNNGPIVKSEESQEFFSFGFSCNHKSTDDYFGVNITPSDMSQDIPSVGDVIEAFLIFKKSPLNDPSPLYLEL